MKNILKNYGSKIIKKTPMNNLQINWDYDNIPRNKYPVLLYTPDMNDVNDHYHISLTLRESIKLRDWLNSFIKEKTRK